MSTPKIQKVFVVCMLVILVACAPQQVAKVVPTATAVPQASEPVEITWLVRSYVSSEQIVEKKIIADFEASHPNVKVNLTVAFGDYDSKFVELNSGGTPPDVWSPSWGMGFREALVRDLLTDLTPLIEKDQIDLADFLPETLDLYKVEGKVMGLPFLTGGTYVFYNKDLFDQAGVEYPPTDWGDTSWDWQAFREKCQALTKVSDPFSLEKDHFGAHFLFDPAWDATAWLWGQEPYPKTAYETGFADEAYLDNPKIIEGVQAYQDLMHIDHCIPNMGEMNLVFSGGHPFNRQKVAMYLTGLWDFPTFQEISNFRWGVAALPYGDKGRLGTIYTFSWVISSGSAHPEEAWTFLKYLASPEVQAQWSQETGFPPVRKSLLDAWYKQFPSMKSEEFAEAFLGSLKYGHQSPYDLLVDYPKINATLTLMINSPILSNTKKAAEVMPAANAALIETLKKIQAEYQK